MMTNQERTEEWRSIPSADDYEASSLGRIRRVKGRRFSQVRILRPGRSPKGYLSVAICNWDRKRRTEWVHRLVAEAFHGPQPEGHQVAHADGCKSNNRADNLRWATPIENQKDRELHGTTIRGEACINAKLAMEDVIAIRTSCERGVVLARRFGISRQNVCNIISRRSWRHV